MPLTTMTRTQREAFVAGERDVRPLARRSRGDTGA